MKQLGTNTHVTKQNMTGMIERLKQNDYVTTYEAQEDRRITLVRLTEKGKQALVRLESCGSLSGQASMDRLRLEELTSFNRCLQQLIENMNDE